jgi:hypothetical protein
MVRSAAQGLDGRQALYQGVPEKYSEVLVYGRRIIASSTGRHMSNFFFLTSGSYRWTQSTVAKSLNDFPSSARYCLQPARE